ncbi:hypothetical protein BX661DRAFT_31132 [Kickxella alabastrina]|uniref:uncharacterized protein n=1 Tax=Kickxella alabastrina TaxID=61397 RepID=UPI00221F717F|nr:uncharacterized protein BX661DRAFT_31132 [Kickxella alabastrina]KAI7826842.1 hypothetical protein BX661DRAFT_31132 [Kickxella alabastrina]
MKAHLSFLLFLFYSFIPVSSLLHTHALFLILCISFFICILHSYPHFIAFHSLSKPHLYTLL